tara:strand:+ start:10421 stop:12409 length:1989 start_codon:yes stop_codon:yes gene_type:complete
MNHWVMDYETMINFFCGVFEHYKTNETKIFIIHELQNDFDELVKFLNHNKDYEERHISFNGLGFDAQISEYILDNEFTLSTLSATDLAYELYKYAQHVIDKSNNRDFLDYYEYNMTIPQLDLYKLNHWDNAAKRSSLKWIQFSMDWYNLKDMPIKHDTSIYSQEDVDMIVNYCINDVKSTKQILYKCTKDITLRKDLTEKYKIKLYSASETKISKELFLHFLSKKSKIKKQDIKYSSTIRDQIIVKDILLPYLDFKHPIFKDLHKQFKEKIIYPEHTKGGFKTSISYQGVKTHFGLGGVHGANKSGIYESNDDMIIMTSDVTSFYPNLAIRNKWAPAHLPKEEFCEQYEWFFDERKKIPKSDPTNYTYKIILNSTYGLSNDKFSFLYDPQFTMQITINGQLTLMMLYEMIMENIPGAIPIMQNTDGIETMIPKDKKDDYLKICKEWEEITSLNLEHDQYQKIVLADVNSYIAVNAYKEVEKEQYFKLKKEKDYELFKIENGKYYHAGVKCKGRFVFNDLPLHKNKSNLISTKALFYYFIHNISPEKYISENKNIFDYCLGVKIKGNWSFKSRSVVKGNYEEESLQKTIRYFISNQGAKLIKVNNNDGREIQPESGKWLVTIFNQYVDKEWEDYNINESYYLNAVYKEIENVAGPKLKQLKLF